MQTQYLGYIVMKYVGEYDETTLYHQLQVVTYDKSSYCCHTDCTVVNTPLTDTDHWFCIAKKAYTQWTDFTESEKTDILSEITKNLIGITNDDTNGFIVEDTSGNIKLKYTSDGLDATKVSEHFLELATANMIPQSFSDVVFTNPSAKGIVPRRIGDTSLNTTTFEIWESVALANDPSSWVRKSAGKYGGTLIEDFNNPNISGVNTALNTALNAPNNTENWYCLHMNSNAGVASAVQIAIGFTTGKIYQRLKINSTYGSWTSVLQEKEIGKLISLSNGSVIKNVNLCNSSLTSIFRGYVNSVGVIVPGETQWDGDLFLTAKIRVFSNKTYLYKTENKNSNVYNCLKDMNGNTVGSLINDATTELTITPAQDGYFYLYWSPNSYFKCTTDFIFTSNYDSLFNKIQDINNNISTINENSGLYHKDMNAACNASNFSKFGYYPTLDAGISLTTGEVQWGIEWSVIYIPISIGITYTITNAGGPDHNRNIVMVDSSLKVTHGISNSVSSITAVDGDKFLAVQYGAIVYPSSTYAINTNIYSAQDTANSALDVISKISIPVNSEFSGKSGVIIKNGYYDSVGNFQDTSNTSYGKTWFTALIPIKSGYSYSFKSAICVPLANHVLLDKNLNVLKEWSITTQDQYVNYTIIQKDDTSDAYYIGIQYDGESTAISVINNESILNIDTEIKSDISTIDIPYLFSLVNPALYSREYVSRLFPESFIDAMPSSPITINYRRDLAINRQHKSTTSYEKIVKSITLRGDGYNELSKNIDVHYLNENVFNNKNVRLLLFGVSFDAIDYANDDGTFEQGGTMTSALLEKYIRQGAVDTNTVRNFVSIGTLGHSNGGTFSYNGNTLSSRGMHEARGGNNGVCYLRQPMNFSPQNIAYDPNVSGTTATGDIMWDMNGLRYKVPYNTEYNISSLTEEVYSATALQLQYLRHTPFGKYHHDYSSALWEFCNNKGLISAVGGSYSTWVGDTTQKGIIDLCMDYIANNPDYPWYSRDKARETSFSNGVIKDINDNTQYSLDMSIYLNRYRTMDDLGVRLVTVENNPSGISVVGSDSVTYQIGTKINNQTLLSSIDVCSPTHVIWDMLYNDWVFYGSGDNSHADGTDALSMADLFVSAIRSQLGENVYIGLKAKRENGSFFPEIWHDIALAQSYTPSTQLAYNKLLIQKYSDLTKKTQWIPIFPVSIPFATCFSQKFTDFLYGSVICQSGDSYSSTSDITHEGLRSAKAMTYQIYGWICFTIK